MKKWWRPKSLRPKGEQTTDIALSFHLLLPASALSTGFRSLFRLPLSLPASALSSCFRSLLPLGWLLLTQRFWFTGLSWARSPMATLTTLSQDHDLEHLPQSLWWRVTVSVTWEGHPRLLPQHAVPLASLATFHIPHGRKWSLRLWKGAV